MTRPQPTPGMDPHLFEGSTPGETELRRLVEQARAAAAWRRSVETLRGVGESEDGVRVEVSASGGVVAVTVPDSACTEGGAAVTEQVLDAVMAAQQDLAAQLRRSSEEAFGEDSPAARTVSGSLDTRFARATALPDTADDAG
ncbi:hypothetical protein [Phycicoccus sp.]|uniref:hypothetical protein n=1 Tax=Phycicoccus sp. TaxID=1902410 RepID=UPI002BCE1B2B|nr:hypothetical protein [Phycicoccus sp.]HMM94604.1 hypothetical protein [Phycicoccus sp.]